jgi:hypothetical protein
MRRVIATAAVLFSLALASPAAAQVSASWDITGGEAWEERTGFGMMIGFGGVDCTKDYCNKTWGTKFFGSFEGTVGAFYRLIPNLTFFLDFGLAHMNTDFTEVEGADDGRGVLFHFVGGGAFHAPITGWMDAHLGFGLGFAWMKLKTEIEQAAPAEPVEVSTTHKGVDFEFRFGADIYLFSAAPTFSVGPYVKLAIPYWVSVCYDSPSGDVFAEGKHCGKPDDIEKDTYNPNDPSSRSWNFDETPMLIHFGLAAKYVF